MSRVLTRGLSDGQGTLHQATPRRVPRAKLPNFPAFHLAPLTPRVRDSLPFPLDKLEQLQYLNGAFWLGLLLPQRGSLGAGQKQ